MLRNNRILLTRTIRGLDAEIMRIKHQERLFLRDIRHIAMTNTYEGKARVDGLGLGLGLGLGQDMV